MARTKEGQANMHRTVVHLPQETYDTLFLLSCTEDRPIAAYVREALKQWLQAQDEQK